jgi:hypothetical protein
MATLVQATVSSLGGDYKDGIPKWEVRVPLSRASGLPLRVGSDAPVRLKIGKVWYNGALLASERTPFAYFSPTLRTTAGERSTLGKVLSDLRVAVNQRLRLEVSGNRIRVTDKWGYGLGTRAAKVNAVINGIPKMLGQICEDANYPKRNSVSPHLDSLLKRNYIVRTPKGYVAADAEEQAESSATEETKTAEKVLRAIADLLGTDLNAEFLVSEIRRLTRVPSGSLGPVLKGMRDEPGSAPSLASRYRGIIRRVSRGVYQLTSKGQELIDSFQTSTPVSESTAGRIARCVGAGFGTPEQNELVEAAARDAVWVDYESRGWDVDTVEHLRCGYDLRCVKGKTEEHVEVKGVRGTRQAFIITTGEVKRAETDPQFVLYLVTAALSVCPVKTRFTGKQFLDHFDLRPVQYQAVPKE